MISLKLAKTARYLRARFKPASALPLYWHIGRPNFGDDINPDFFGRLAKSDFRFAINQNQPHFLGIGKHSGAGNFEIDRGRFRVFATTASDLDCSP
jgi:hypothetical protein